MTHSTLESNYDIHELSLNSGTYFSSSFSTRVSSVPVSLYPQREYFVLTDAGKPVYIRYPLSLQLCHAHCNLVVLVGLEGKTRTAWPLQSELCKL